MKFSFGTDPEFMLSKDGKIYSAIGIVKGSKEQRKKIGKHAIYYDNVMAECAVAPAKTKEEALANIQDCLQRYAQAVTPYRLETLAAHYFPPDQLRHPEAMKISCDPETCVYEQNEIAGDKDLLKGTNLRTAGGHVHLGSKLLKEGENDSITILLLDLFLGLPSLFLDKDPSTKIRKELYGKAGRFREPPHGVEYRTIGNYWLSSPKLTSFVYDVCEFTLEFVEDRKWETLWEVDEERLEADDRWCDPDFHPANHYRCIGYDVKKLRNAIDTSDLKKAAPFVDQIKTLMPTKLYNQFESLNKMKQCNPYEEWKLNA